MLEPRKQGEKWSWVPSIYTDNWVVGGLTAIQGQGRQGLETSRARWLEGKLWVKGRDSALIYKGGDRWRKTDNVKSWPLHEITSHALAQTHATYTAHTYILRAHECIHAKQEIKY